jgi:rhomboid protease GluP
MMVPIHQNLTSKQADTYGLILSSAGIYYQTLEDDFGWQIRVHENDVDAARYQIHKYEEENPPARKPKPPLTAQEIQFSNGVIAALLLLAIHIVVGDRLAALIPVYGASASRIMDGEIYRTATALLLHSDAVHLIGNMAAIALFGSVVCTILGFGVGWLMILFSGMFGNYLNAYLHQSFHISIGSSTAVFGAVGIAAAHQFWHKIGRPGERYKAWLPIAGGFALLAILGTGAGRVDVMAHLFGFVCGLFIQTAYRGFALHWQMEVLPFRYHVLCLAITLLILVFSWTAPAPDAPGFR